MFAAHVVAPGAHCLEDIAVTHLGTDQVEALAVEEAFKAKVGHDGGNDPAPTQLSARGKLAANQGHDLVTIDGLALFIDHDQPVGITIQGNADVRAAGDNAFLYEIEVGRAALVVDVGAVGRNANRNNLCTQFPDCRRGDLVSGTIGAIDHDLQAIKPDIIGKRGFHRVDVTAAGIIDPAGPSDLRRGRQRQVLFQHGLDRGLVGIGKLEAVRAEQLDAVILIGVVAGRNHHADVGAQLAGKQGDGRGGHGTQQDHVHADAGEPGDQSVFEHIAREAGILADHDPVFVAATQEARARGLADFHRDCGGHHPGVGAAADPVGTEIVASHHLPCSSAVL